MQFLFHSVIDTEGHAKYYNIYQVDESVFLAECHHFNRERACDGDFELRREGEEWTSLKPGYEEAAQQIGEEIERMTGTAD
jgi:hypothetical protein